MCLSFPDSKAGTITVPVCTIAARLNEGTYEKMAWHTVSMGELRRNPSNNTAFQGLDGCASLL